MQTLSPVRDNKYQKRSRNNTNRTRERKNNKIDKKKKHNKTSNELNIRNEDVAFFIGAHDLCEPRLGKKHYKTVKPVLMERAIIMADVIAIAWNRCNKNIQM